MNELTMTLASRNGTPLYEQIYLYIKEHNNIHQLCAYYYKPFEKLFSFTKLNIDTDRREIQILENVLLLLFDEY